MINIIKKELFIYVTIVLVMMFLIHPDLLSNPIQRLENMQSAGNYIHPILYTLLIYFVLWIFRVIFSFIRRLFR